MTLTGEFALKDHRLLVGGQDLVSERDGYLWSHKALLKHRFGFHCNETNSIQHVEKRHDCVHNFINIKFSSLIIHGKCILFWWFNLCIDRICGDGHELPWTSSSAEAWELPVAFCMVQVYWPASSDVTSQTSNQWISLSWKICVKPHVKL